MHLAGKAEYVIERVHTTFFCYIITPVEMKLIENVLTNQSTSGYAWQLANFQIRIHLKQHYI